MTDLAAFFAAIVPYLRGESTAADLTRAIGPLPSGAPRTDVYPWLVRGDLRRVLRDLFPGVRGACAHVSPCLFDDLCTQYAADHPPTHFELYRFGAGFADFLGARATAGGCPPCLEELADFHYTRYRCLTAEATEPTWDESVFVRRYAFATPAFVARCERGDEVTTPEADPRTYLLFRSIHDQRAHWQVVTTPMLLAVAQHFQPESAPPTLVAGVDDRVLGDARDRLRELGVLR